MKVEISKNDKIYIAGHNGLAGSGIHRALIRFGYKNIITKSKHELDLTKSIQVEKFILKHQPDCIIIAAAAVGGIYANDNFPVNFILDNLKIQINIIENAFKYNTKKLLFIGSSCAYPKHCAQPIKEEYLLSGYLEETNKPYAIAKLAGITTCQAYEKQYNKNFISIMPTNIYGPNDNFSDLNSHVIPALINRTHKQKINNKNELTVWGTGKPLREFLYVDDFGDAIVFLMENYYSSEIINVGTQIEITIENLVKTIKNVIGYEGKIIWDKTKPDGTPRKLLDCSKILKLGWSPKYSLIEGLETTYKWYVDNYNNLRK